MTHTTVLNNTTVPYNTIKTRTSTRHLEKLLPGIRLNLQSDLCQGEQFSLDLCHLYGYSMIITVCIIQPFCFLLFCLPYLRLRAWHAQELLGARRLDIDSTSVPYIYSTRYVQCYSMIYPYAVLLFHPACSQPAIQYPGAEYCSAIPQLQQHYSSATGSLYCMA